jgi:hypothetical protein
MEMLEGSTELVFTAGEITAVTSASRARNRTASVTGRKVSPNSSLTREARWGNAT